ncbi:uncharacterized protein LOC120662719 [Panicum virgatum]|uniref:uncharacterized protein LOC120662719 n=1 Tax=Panicum virgatum TaxID=38727 RepID=UPI0019D53820|nr:uncharacterized protein LOC120662719 [Panicum virgatum]
MVHGLSHSRYFWASYLYRSHLSSSHLSTLSSGVLGAQAAAASHAGRRVGAGVRPPAAAARRSGLRRSPPLRGARVALGPANAWNARGKTAATAAATQSAVARPWLSRWARDVTESHRSSTTPPWKSSDSTRKGTTTTMGSNSTRTMATFSSRISVLTTCSERKLISVPFLVQRAASLKKSLAASPRSTSPVSGLWWRRRTRAARARNVREVDQGRSRDCRSSWCPGISPCQSSRRRGSSTLGSRS